MPDDGKTLVIGGGSGGIAFARRAASYGRDVTVIEGARPGGTCVNLGCVPKKIMWYAAERAHALEHADGYGFAIDDWRHDWTALKRGRDEFVRWLNGIYLRNLDKSGAKYIEGWARLTAPGTVEVNGESLHAAHVVIATGGVPAVPAVPGAELGITSDGFFELDQCPRSVAIIGAGYVAVELAGMLRALGAAVTLFSRGETVLRSFDPMLGEALCEHMDADGIDRRKGANAIGLSGKAGAVTVQLDGGAEEGPYEVVIWAVGRRPVTNGLGLDRAGIITDDAGHVQTDEFQATNVVGHFALGDVTGRLALTPVAIAAGRRLADRLYGGQADRHMDYECVPSVVFTHPPIGTVGLSEPDARAKFGDAVQVFTSRFSPMAYALTPEFRRPASMKLVTVGAEQRVVGCHVIGDGADEMLQGFAVAVRMGATKRDFDDTVAIHPTNAEEMVTMK